MVSELLTDSHDSGCPVGGEALQMVAHGPSFPSLKYSNSPEVNYADSVATMGDMAHYFAGPAVMQTNQPKSFMSSFHIVTPMRLWSRHPLNASWLLSG
ncbi:Cytochrome P450 11B2 [Manis pentadactyla]|nr:Cytochrome P450 11B2 [Manis pentadactyla]